MSKHLPKGWKNIALGELIQRGRPITYGVVQPGNYDPEGIPLIRGGDYSVGWRPLAEIFRVAPAVERSFARARLRAGDLVMTIKGDVGTVAQVPTELDGANISQTNARLAIDEKKALSRFVLNFLRSPMGRIEIYKATQIGAQPGLVFGDIAAFKVPLPPLPEQQRIVTLLDLWDQAIDQSERLLAAKQLRYRGLLLRLVGPAFADQAPDNWVLRRLGQVFSEREERSADLPLLAITGARGVVPRDQLDRRQTASEDKSKYKIIRPGDIGFNTMRMWQGVFGRSEHTGIVSPAYTVVTAIDGLIDPVFAAHLFTHPKAISLFYRYSQGLVDDTLMLKFPQFSQIYLRLPDIGRQRELGKILDAEDAGLSQHYQHVAALRNQKRGLMQKLLTGDWRLDERFDPQALAPQPSLVGGAA